MADHLRPFWDSIIFQLKGAKIIESENDLKWSAIKFLYDNAKNKHKSFLSNFENVKFEKMILLFYLFFGVKLCLQFQLTAQFSTILIYRTRAIISRGLYFFNPFFTAAYTAERPIFHFTFLIDLQRPISYKIQTTYSGILNAYRNQKKRTPRSFCLK